MSAFYLPEHYVQIDIVKIEENNVICNLYTGTRCIKMIMSVSDSNTLIRDGFFIRSRNEADSAGVLNTTKVFTQQ